MTTKKFLIGCGVAIAVVGLIVAIGAALWIHHVSQDPEDLTVRLEGGTEARVGVPFELAVVVRNDRAKKAVGLTDIDVADTYLDAFVVLGTEPAAKSSTHVPISNAQSFTFDRDIAAGDSVRFVFTLRPLRPGFFRGDVDVCEGQRFLTTLAQTEVTRDD